MSAILDDNTTDMAMEETLISPRFYTTYRSESFNGMLAAIARGCHSLSFYGDVHLRASVLNARSIAKHMTNKAYNS